MWTGGGVAAIWSEVPREEFCGSQAEAHLQDLAWLAPRVWRHQAVVEQILRQGPVLPARFATLFVSLDSLQRFVCGHRAAIVEFLAELGDRREWAVKVFRDRTHLRRRVAGGKAPSGRRYLEARRVQAEAGKSGLRRLKAACQEAASQLQHNASAFRERQVWKSADPGEPGEMVLNWAFLVPAGGEAGFEQCVQQLDARNRNSGLRFVSSGPWPPYSFAPSLERGGKPEGEAPRARSGADYARD